MTDEIHARRLTSQLLAGEPARDPVAVAERLLAIQGQDRRGVRTSGLTAADADRALTEERSLVLTWLNRARSTSSGAGLPVAARADDAAALHRQRRGRSRRTAL